MEGKSNFLQFREIVRQDIPLSDKDSLTKRIGVTLGIFDRSSIDACIYKVPNEIRKVKRDAYSPHIVSIGPLHHGEPDLLAMEEHKWKYMLELLLRTDPDPETSKKKCRDAANAITKLEEEVRGSYAANIKLNNFELAEIMLVDGCFILELLLQFKDSKLQKDGDKLIIPSAWMVPTLQQDLLLLENQIPFAVLKELFSICVPSLGESCSVIDLVLSFFEVNTNQGATINKSSNDVRHLLDLLHDFYFPKSHQMDPKQRKVKGTRGFRKCATELYESGIEFAAKVTEDNLLNISFDKGVITIPQLHLTDTKVSLLRNLISFEQCSLGSTTLYMTSYAFLIKSLISSSRDIKLLLEKEIIKNDLGGTVEDVRGLFNRISREVVLKEFCFGVLCEKVNAHQKNWCLLHTQRAFWVVWMRRQYDSLKRNYFRNTWVTLSVIAAVVLLVLTTLQTIYTVWSFYE